MRRFTGPLILVVSALGASQASAQLSKWLVRDLNGVYVMDLSTPTPTVGPFIAGLGTGGTEDVNMMTDAANNILFSIAVDDMNMISVFDATMNQMPNGSGLFGHTSALQSAICPIPCHPDQYFIIHLVTGATGDLYYSIVDMSLNSGLGDVTVKNMPIGPAFTEGLAIGHQLPNGCRWLFTSLQNGNTYDLVRCLISESGIGPPTVIASVTTVAPAYNFNEIELSADNMRLAMNVYTTSPAEPDIALWDLDLSSGTVSNPQTLSVSSDPIIGLQFSPLGNYLYYVGNGNSDDMDFGRVELSTGSPELIDPFMGRYLTMAELAGNGRIYVGLNYNSTYMAEVTDPDNTVLANIGYTHDAVYISGTGCRPPMPNAIEGEPPGSTTTPGFIDFSAYAIAGCDTYQFVDSTCLSTWWEWDLGDGTITNDPAPTHQFAAGTYDITLRVVACGDTLTLTKFAYITSTSAVADAAMTIPASICLGETITFVNGSTGSTSYLWDFGDGTQSSDFEPAYVYAAQGVYPVTLIASSSCGSDTIVGSITVQDGADVAFEWSSDPCEPEATFTNTSSAGATWLWDFGDGYEDVAASPTHSYAAPGSYTIQLIGAPGALCADTVSLDITILEAPLTAFTSISGCDLDVAFSDVSTGAIQWTWDLGDGTSSTDTDPQHTFPAAGDYAVSLIAQGANGCTDTSSTTITIAPVVIAGIDVTGDPCQLLFVFSSTASNASGQLWDFGDGSTDTSSVIIHTYAGLGSYTVSLVADPDSTCADTAYMEVDVLDPPLASFAFTIDCGMQVSFADASIDAATLEWDLGDGTMSVVPDPVHAYASGGAYDVTLLVTSANGCVDDSTATLVVSPDPIAAFTMEGDPCSTERVFTNTSQWTLSNLWLFGDGATSTDGSPTHVFAPGDHTVVLIADPNGPCADTLSLFFAIDTIPEAAFSDSVGCALDAYVLDASASADGVTWYWGDGATDFDSTAQHTYAAEGTYTIVQVVTNAAGCSDSTSVDVTIPPMVRATFTGALDPCTSDLVVTNSSANAMAQWWSFGDGGTSAQFEPDHQYDEGGTYLVTLIAFGADGCTDTTSVMVDAQFAGIPAGFYAPNVFTPNGDGVNDLFRIVGLPECVAPMLRIFNRWGELLFEEPATKAWDGTYGKQVVPDGVYMYVLSDARMEIRGHVTVLR
ncbi:MAG: PKD domain-containing protein [Flavobacteriales bacterium]